EVVVEAEAAIADDVEPVLLAGDEVVERSRLRVRLQRNVWHALNRKRHWAVAIGAAIRLAAADERRLAHRHLVVLEHAVLDDRKLRTDAAHAVVIESDGRQSTGLRSIRHDRHHRTAELERAELLRRQEGRSGEIGLPAESTVELGGMTDRFVDRQPEIGRIEHEIVFARRDRLCPKLLLDLLSGQGGFGYEVMPFDILPAFAARRRKACAAGEPSGLPINGRYLEIRPAADSHLANLAAAAAGKQLVLAHEPHQ